jgi:nucleoside-diphosphate-sugar epimerase
MKANILPARIRNEDELDEVMSRPSPELVEAVASLQSPLVVLGAGGKMGPSLCAMARRAADEAGHPLEVIAVSRFSSEPARRWLEDRGVRIHPADLTDRAAVEALPDSANVLYYVGLKFGTRDNPAQTWAVNTLVPAFVSERYPAARIVALSTGNVYPLIPVAQRGSREGDPLTPLGEYANAAVARERIFEYFSARQETPMALIRLNYAVDLKYGVLVDIARKIKAGTPVDLTMGYFNCIWQRDANDMILRAFDLARVPARAFNLTGTEILSVRAVADKLADAMEMPVQFTGEEAETALLSDASRLVDALGAPPTPLATLIEWTADWVRRGGDLLEKPTGFEVRDGRY